jgi:hypothetical protein
VKTDNPSALTVVKRKVCNSVIALYLSVIKKTCNQGANKSNQPEPTSFVMRTTLHMTI